MPVVVLRATVEASNPRNGRASGRLVRVHGMAEMRGGDRANGSCNPSAPLSRYRRPATAAVDASRIKHVHGRPRAPTISSLDTPSPDPGQAAVSVRIAGLTCRDVLVASFDPQIATTWYVMGVGWRAWHAGTSRHSLLSISSRVNKLHFPYTTDTQTDGVKYAQSVSPCARRSS